MAAEFIDKHRTNTLEPRFPLLSCSSFVTRNGKTSLGDKRGASFVAEKSDIAILINFPRTSCHVEDRTGRIGVLHYRLHRRTPGCSPPPNMGDPVLKDLGMRRLYRLGLKASSSVLNFLSFVRVRPRCNDKFYYELGHCCSSDVKLVLKLVSHGHVAKK